MDSKEEFLRLHPTQSVALVYGGDKEKKDSVQSARCVLDNLPKHFSVAEVKLDSLDQFYTSEVLRKNNTVVFNSLHGGFGGNGELCRLLEQRGIPFTGCGSLLSALTYNKASFRALAKALDIKTPPFQRVVGNVVQFKLDENLAGKKIVVKPARAGSHDGLTILEEGYTYEQLQAAVKTALREDYSLDNSTQTAIIEEFIVGDEYSLGIVAGVMCPMVVRVHTGSTGLDFHSGFVLEDVSPDDKRKFQKLCRKVTEKLSTVECLRIDLIQEKQSGELYVLEFDSHPGLRKKEETNGNHPTLHFVGDLSKTTAHEEVGTSINVQRSASHEIPGPSLHPRRRSSSSETPRSHIKTSFDQILHDSLILRQFKDEDGRSIFQLLIDCAYSKAYIKNNVQESEQERAYDVYIELVKTLKKMHPENHPKDEFQILCNAFCEWQALSQVFDRNYFLELDSICEKLINENDKSHFYFNVMKELFFLPTLGQTEVENLLGIEINNFFQKFQGPQPEFVKFLTKVGNTNSEFLQTPFDNVIHAGPAVFKRFLDILMQVNSFELCSRVKHLCESSSNMLNRNGMLLAIVFHDLLCLRARSRLAAFKEKYSHFGQIYLQELLEEGESRTISMPKLHTSLSQLSSGVPNNSPRENALLKHFHQYKAAHSSQGGQLFMSLHNCLCKDVAHHIFGETALLSQTPGTSRGFLDLLLSLELNQKKYRVVIASPLEYPVMIDRIPKEKKIYLKSSLDTLDMKNKIIDLMESEMFENLDYVFVLISSCLRLGGRYFDLKPLLDLSNEKQAVHILVDASQDHRVDLVSLDKYPKVVMWYSKRLAGSGGGIAVTTERNLDALKWDFEQSNSSINLDFTVKSIASLMAHTFGVCFSLEDMRNPESFHLWGYSENGDKPYDLKDHSFKLMKRFLENLSKYNGALVGVIPSLHNQEEIRKSASSSFGLVLSLHFKKTVQEGDIVEVEHRISVNGIAAEVFHGDRGSHMFSKEQPLPESDYDPGNFIRLSFSPLLTRDEVDHIFKVIVGNEDYGQREEKQ